LRQRGLAPGAPTHDAEIEVHGERLRLMPERAVFWERTSTLIVADTHWGKAAAFRAGGLAVPRGTTSEGLARLEAALERTGARRIVYLGDFLHARQGRQPATLDRLAEWRRSRSGVEMLLVRGNHDRGAGDPPRELEVECADPPVAEAPFVYAHHPGGSPLGYVLSGHVHPAVRLSGRGRQRERLACFLFCGWGAILPSFGDFTGAGDVAPCAGERVFVIAGNDVVEVPGREG
jgi:DNA ligase-associated metallophosphoesterase